MRRCFVLSLLLQFTVVTLAWCQTPAATDSTPAVESAPKSSGLTAALQLIESATDMEATAKTAAVEFYRQAQSAQEAARAFQEKAAAFTKQTDAIPQQLQAAKDFLNAPLPEPTVDAAQMSLNELDNTVLQKQSAVEAARQELNSRSSSIDARANRMLKIQEATTNASTRLAEVESQLAAAPPEKEDARVTAARNAMLQQRREALQGEMESLKQENLLLTSSSELLPLERDVAKKKLDATAAELERWREAAQRRRESEVDRDIRLANTFAQNAPDPLRRLADANVKSANARRETEDKLRNASRKQNDLQEILNKVESQFKRAQSEAGSKTAVTRLLGDSLRSRRQELKQYEEELLTSRELEDRAAEVRVQRFLYGESLADLEDIDDAVATQREILALPPELEPVLRKQLEFRKSLLTGLATDTDALFKTLVRLESTQSALKTQASRYATFIDERVLWIRSTAPFRLQEFQQVGLSFDRILDPAEWQDLPSRSLAAFKARPLVPLLIALVFVPLIFIRARVLGVITSLGSQAESGTCREFDLTLRASLLTISLAIVWPSILVLLSYWLGSFDASGSDVIMPLSAGLRAMGITLMPINLWWYAARPQGLMISHFGVSPRVAEIIRRHLRLLSYSFVLLIGLYSAIGAAGEPIYYQSLGRIVFVAAMVCLSIFIYHTMHPVKGATVGYFARRSETFVFKGRFVWLWLLVAIPWVFSAMCLMGYQFTADQLTVRIFFTAVSLLLLWIMQAIVLRWVVLSRRRLAMEQARARLAKASQQTEATQTEVPTDIETIDLSSVDQQTRRLVRAITFVAGALMMWSLWSGVLPALSRFEEMRAWDVQVMATVDAPASTSGEDSSATGTTVRPTLKMVSYADVFVAIMIFIAMLIAMRDLPGLLELVLLQRLPLDVALRFAITTLTRYVIFVVGTALALGRLEIGWSQVQWLVAGVSVGLGFGMQEIFANFVSGLIILFERPLRAGDIVTIDGVTGVVKNIRLRSTVIQDWDRKDLIVPNKDFITGRLLNWTLSAEVSRIVIPIGIAYGSDTDAAKSTIMSVITEHPLIVSEPAPMVTFEEFGDSSLNLIVRCFISMDNMSQRLTVIDELYSKINLRLQAANIEIPFPQRDLHVRSTTNELPSELQPSTPPAAANGKAAAAKETPAAAQKPEA